METPEQYVEEYSKSCQTSSMELFARKVTLEVRSYYMFAKRSILDVYQVYEHAFGIVSKN